MTTIAHNTGDEQMEQLELIQPMQSDSINELAKAMSAMQTTDLFAITDSTNPFFSSKYADLSSVWSAIRKPLTDNGLAIIQTTEPHPDGVVVVTTLMHESGEWIRGRLAGTIVPDKKGHHTPQGLLSLITYLRRAGVSAITGVCPDDDDGESVSGRDKSPQSKTPSKQNDTPQKLNGDEHVMVDYTMPGEDSFAMQQLKELRPTATILNNEKTLFKVGKFTTEISEDGKQIWIDAPKFGRPNFDGDACVPCLIAGLVRAHGVPFVNGKYGIGFETVKNDGGGD